ncbi:MAG: hypothetical protein HDS37_03400 [Bacteroides sp.]|nr:hypothetical protein [Bacteroides sp.]
MKKIYYCFILGALALSVSSCAPKFSQVSYFVDYRQAADGKVFLTESNSVSFDYTPIGSILIEETAGNFKEYKEMSEKSKVRDIDPIYGDYQPYMSKGYRFPTAASALDYVANKALEMGGDGIINLKMVSTKSKDNRMQLVISGMVIKRK